MYKLIACVQNNKVFKINTVLTWYIQSTNKFTDHNYLTKKKLPKKTWEYLLKSQLVFQLTLVDKETLFLTTSYTTQCFEKSRQWSGNFNC